MNKSFKQFYEKSRDVASNKLFKYCHMQEEIVNGEKVVWSLENLKSGSLFFNYFDKYQDFQELKMAYKVTNEVKYIIDEFSIIESDSIHELKKEELDEIVTLFNDVDITNVESYEIFFQSDIFGEMLDSKLKNSNIFNNKEVYNQKYFITHFMILINQYIESNAIAKEKVNILEFFKWIKKRTFDMASNVKLTEEQIDQVQNMISALKKKINDNFCCTCLSKTYDNLNNWQNYSKGKNGFVIEFLFNVEDSKFYENLTFLEVKYASTPVELDMKLLGRVNRNPYKYASKVNMLYHLAEIIRTKNIDLDKEKEVRIVSNHKFMRKRNYVFEANKFIKNVYVYKDNQSIYLDDLVNTCNERKIPIIWLKDSIDSFNPRIYKSDTKE